MFQGYTRYGKYFNWGESFRLRGESWFRTFTEACGIGSSENVQDFYKCFENVTFDAKTMILDTKKFNHEEFSFEDTNSSWTPVYHVYFGQCLTSNNVDSLKDGQFLKIYFNLSLNYEIWLHDPDFFFLSLNERSVPKFELEYNAYEMPEKLTLLQTIETRKYGLINRVKAS